MLDDIKDLWAEFDFFAPHHVFAAAHITALSHVNGGLALYHLARTASVASVASSRAWTVERRMRAANWTAVALSAAQEGLIRSQQSCDD